MPAPFPLSRFRAALFDIDGTLMDSTEQCIRGLSDTYAHFSGQRPSDAEILATVGIPLTVQLKMFGLGECDDAQLETRVAYALGRYEAYEDRVREHRPAVEAMVCAHELGLKIALVTSKNAAEVVRFRHLFSEIGRVDAIVCASDVAHPKPHRESADRACRLLNVRPSEAVFIGDSIFDIRCARGAGTAAVAVAYGASSPTTLAAEAPDLLFATPEELLAWAAHRDLMPYAKKETATCYT